MLLLARQVGAFANGSNRRSLLASQDWSSVCTLCTLISNSRRLLPIACKGDKTVQNKQHKLTNSHPPIKANQIVTPVSCQKEDRRNLHCKSGSTYVIHFSTHTRKTQTIRIVVNSTIRTAPARNATHPKLLSFDPCCGGSFRLPLAYSLERA
jgi:hypothetical protein